jgi:F-type H+-transporting ATPase subunit gamma
VDRYVNGEIDAVYVIGNEFKSVISQKIVSFKLLPLTVEPDQQAIDFIIEGDAKEILASLLPRYIEHVFLRIMLESAAAEHAARMTAMDAATNNASDVIEGLTLHMNRVRQASITKEIIEVVSGAQAAE